MSRHSASSARLSQRNLAVGSLGGWTIRDPAARTGSSSSPGSGTPTDHSIVGWSMGKRQTTDLVVAALVMALAR